MELLGEVGMMNIGLSLSRPFGSVIGTPLGLQFSSSLILGGRRNAGKIASYYKIEKKPKHNLHIINAKKNNNIRFGTKDKDASKSASTTTDEQQPKKEKLGYYRFRELSVHMPPARDQTKCPGCGIQKQTENPDQLGYSIPRSEHPRHKTPFRTPNYAKLFTVTILKKFE